MTDQEKGQLLLAQGANEQLDVSQPTVQEISSLENVLVLHTIDGQELAEEAESEGIWSEVAGGGAGILIGSFAVLGAGSVGGGVLGYKTPVCSGGGAGIGAVVGASGGAAVAGIGIAAKKIIDSRCSLVTPDLELVRR